MDEDYFIRAMLSEPDNDMHRLLYADWLEENGNEEIASLIREAHSWTPGGNADHRIAFYSGRELAILIHHRGIGFHGKYYRDWFYVNRRGGTAENKHNWAWLLSLGMKHGLDIN